jgi:SAM-dependent methyltransferase
VSDQLFWEDRYANPEFAYGREPNVFFKNSLLSAMPGKILFPAEGEGRNAVYAARMGWDVWAFDWSREGQRKALELANEAGVSIRYEVSSFDSVQFSDDFFDCIVLVYAHFDVRLRAGYHQQLIRYLKPNGILIFEAFSKRNLEYLKRDEKIGGPRDERFLFSLEDVKSEFQELDFICLEESEVNLREGVYHNGKGSVVRFVARRKVRHG